jgi:hypothetical protein
MICNHRTTYPYIFYLSLPVDVFGVLTRRVIPKIIGLR